jgi:hypothetical protein
MLLAITPAIAAETPVQVPGQLAEEQPAAAQPPQKVKYKAGKDVDFEQMVIQGQLKRPDLMVVTGNEAAGTNGLLKLRENFLDRTAADIGESSDTTLVGGAQ